MKSIISRSPNQEGRWLSSPVLQGSPSWRHLNGSEGLEGCYTMQYYIASPQEPRAGQGYTASNFETKPPISDLNKKYNLIEHQELSLGDASIYKVLEESPQASSLSEQPAFDYFPARGMLGRRMEG